MKRLKELIRILYKSRISLVFILALLIRLTLFSFSVAFHQERALTPDSYGYDRLAINMLKHHRFSTSEHPPWIPQLARTPLYPLFLSCVYLLFGHNISVAILFQIILSVLVVLVTYALGIKLFNKNIAVWAAFIIAVDPISVIYSNYLLTESLFTLLLVLSSYFLIYSLNEGKIFHVITLGFLLGFSTLTRPTSLYFPIVLIFIFVYKYKLTAKLVVRLVILLIAFLIPVGSWIGRNYTITETFLLSNIKDSALLYYNAAAVQAKISGKSYIEVRDEFQRQYPLDIINNPQEYKANVKLARAIILSHPFTSAYMTLKGIARTLFGPGVASCYQLLGFNKVTRVGNIAKLLIIILSSTILVLEYFGLLYGAFTLTKERNYFALIFILLPIIYFVIPPAIFGYSRYKVPVVPYISLASGLGFHRIWYTIKERRNQCR